MVSAAVAAVNTGTGFEGVERAHEELRAAVPHVDDTGAVRHDGQGVRAGEGQRQRLPTVPSTGARHEAASVPPGAWRTRLRCPRPWTSRARRQRA